MIRSNLIGQENRLLHYIKTPYTTKPPTRQVVSSDPYTIKAPDGSTQTIQRSTTQSTADANAAYQTQQRAGTLDAKNYTTQTTVDGGLDAGPLRTITGSGPMQPTGTVGTPLPQFASLEDAQKAQQDYYTKYGAGDPAIEAAITRLQNPGVDYGPTGLPGTGSSVDYKSMANQGLTSPYAKPTDPRNPTGYIPKGAVVDANAAARATRLGLVDTSTLTQGKAEGNAGVAETPEQFASRIAAVEAANTSKLANGAILTQQKTQQKADQRASMGTTEAPSPSSLMIDQLRTMAMSNPDLAQFLPQIEAMAAAQNAPSQAQGIADAQLNDLAAEDLNSDGVSDGVAAAASESKALLADEKNQSDVIAKENRDIAREAADIAKEMAEIEKSKFELQQLRNENQLREQNIEAEIKNRRVAGALGINYDANGLKWMQTEIRKGNEALAFLEQGGDIQSAQFALQIGKGYALDVRAALNDHASVQFQLDSTFRKELESIDSMVSSDAASRRKEKQELAKWLFDAKDKEDTRKATQLNSLYTSMFDAIKENEKTKRDGMKESRDYAKSMRDEIRLNPTLKDFKEINTKFAQLENSYNMYRNGQIDPGTADQALITLFNKMLDPTSVVREGEYIRTEQQQGLFRQIQGGLLKAWNGGAAIDDNARASIVELAREMAGEYNRRAQAELEPYLLDVEQFNSDNPTNPVDVARLFNMGSIYLDDTTLNGIEGAIASALGETTSYSEPPTNISTGSSMLDGVITAYGSSAWAPGLDIATGGKPNPIFAQQGGTVVSAVYDPSWKGSPNDPSGKQQNSGFGNQVKIRFDDGTEGWFSHLSNVSVQQGSRVEPGQQLGNVGNTGYTMGSTGYHLDLTVVEGYENGKPKYMDPKQIAVWMRGGVPVASAADYPVPTPQGTPAPVAPAPVIPPPLPSPGAGRTLGVMGSAPTAQTQTQMVTLYHPSSNKPVSASAGSSTEQYYREKGYNDQPFSTTPGRPMVLGGVTIPS